MNTRIINHNGGRTGLETIFLFDLDGVLIRPGGYRAAYGQVMEHYFHRLGLNGNINASHLAERFEAHGVTCEWDMLAISLAMIIDYHLAQNERSQSLSSLEEWFDWAGGFQPPATERLLEEIDRVGPIARSGTIPSLRLLEESRKPASEFLPHVSNHPVADEVLGTTRSVAQNDSTRRFQELVIGTSQFQTSYGFKPEYDGESYLKQFDLPMISPDVFSRVKDAAERGRIAVCAYTARPSLQPRGQMNDGGEYSPEGELALGQVGAANWNLMAFGKLDYFARQVGAVADSLLKPAPFQALAAMAAALCNDEWRGLLWAGQIYRQSSLMDWQGDPGGRVDLQLPEKIQLHVFEDSPIGIQAAQAASGLLLNFNCQVELHAWGVGVNPRKVETLRSLGATVFEHTDDAVKSALAIAEVS